MTKPKEPDRLEILMSEYEACRDDERSFTATSAALYGVTATLIGLLAAAATQTCNFHTGVKTCIQVPDYVVAGAPLLPIIVFAFAQTQAAISVVRNYYIRGLEEELATYAPEPLRAFRAMTSIPPMSYEGVLAGLTSLRRGRIGFRLLINFIFLAVIVVFGGITVYFALHVAFPYRIGMLLVYGSISLLLITETFAATIHGRGLFVKTVEEFAKDRKRDTGFPGLPEHAERSLMSYLLLPRQEELVKWLIAPGVFAVAAWVSGTLSQWPQFLLLWFIFEYLIYNARYQWNDARGIDEDEIHNARFSRKRLPLGTGNKAVASIWTSLAVAACRILAAIIIGIYTGLFTPVAILTATVFSVAVVYEFLRWFSKRPESARSTGWRHDAVIYAIWMIVGLGYAIRAAVGFFSARVPMTSPIMIIGLAFFAAFGVTFVLLTWVLEASSYCWTSVGTGLDPSEEKTWYMADALRSRPHIKALLSYVDVKIGPATPALGAEFGGMPDTEDPGYCGNVRILKAPRKKKNPWNAAFVVGAGLGATEGVSLAAPSRHTALLYILSAFIGIVGALAVVWDNHAGRRTIWAVLTACVLSLLPIIGATKYPVILVGSIPWVAIAGLYVMFRGSSYSDLKKFTPSAILEKVRKLMRLGLFIILKIIVGKQTLKHLQDMVRVPSSSGLVRRPVRSIYEARALHLAGGSRGGRSCPRRPVGRRSRRGSCREPLARTALRVSGAGHDGLKTVTFKLGHGDI